MKKFVFTIDSDEIVIKANSILAAVTEIKELTKVVEGKRDIKFIGIKY
ncbi:hypothetical protein [Bacillus sp. SA1-12]|nr:hypothetical protein [Bacillus sp. SA1-12]